MTSPMDERIPALQRAVLQMREGEFDVVIPHGPPDAVDALGKELSRLAEVLEQHFEEARKLQYIAEEMTSGLFLDEVLDKIFESFRSVIPYNRLGAAFLSDDKQHLSHYWGRSDAEHIFLLPGFTAAMANSSLKAILETGRPRILNDLESHLADNPYSEATRLMLREGVHSSLTCPLIAHGKPIGFLFFSSFDKHTYANGHLGSYMRLAVQVSLLIEKSRLYQELYEVNQELLEAKRILQEQASRDELTGLFNRRAIMDLLQSRISRAKREGAPVSLIMIDIDFFKKINDSHGHPFGDLALRAVAERLSQGIRDYNRLGRYGGEEFMVVLEGDDAAAAESVAERLRASMAEEELTEGKHRVRLTISVGVAMVSKVDDVDCHQLIAVADQALYEAKQNGRNRVKVRRL